MKIKFGPVPVKVPVPPKPAPYAMLRRTALLRPLNSLGNSSKITVRCCVSSSIDTGKSVENLRFGLFGRAFGEFGDFGFLPAELKVSNFVLKHLGLKMTLTFSFSCSIFPVWHPSRSRNGKRQKIIIIINFRLLPFVR